MKKKVEKTAVGEEILKKEKPEETCLEGKRHLETILDSIHAGILVV
jgi:hypothetical protein